MVLYVVVVAVLNVGLGFALAVYLANRYRQLAGIDPALGQMHGSPLDDDVPGGGDWDNA